MKRKFDLLCETKAGKTRTIRVNATDKLQAISKARKAGIVRILEGHETNEKNGDNT